MEKHISQNDPITWETFLTKVGEIEAEMPSAPHLLFRGQKNGEWGLETTLERAIGETPSLVYDYFTRIYEAKPRIEATTQKSWDLPELMSVLEFLDSRAMEMSYFSFPGLLKIYEYMAYLRHHGFPSPLLDWTKSQYIAAYFAFNNVEKNVQSVSIFVYQEYGKSGIKLMDQSKPIIEPIRSMINPHLKHFLQQAQHTLCTTINDKAYYFGNHQKILGDSEAPQDRLWHFKLLASEKNKVLSFLTRVNINSWALLQTEEGLMDDIAKENFPY